MTTDPSGFPDGANNQAYAPSATFQLDPCGLWRIQVNGPATYSDRTQGNDSGLFSTWNWLLSLSAETTTTKVTAYAHTNARKYNNLTGILGTENDATGILSINIALDSGGFLTGNLPAGDAHTDTRASAGVALTATGFGGTSRTGSVTVDLKAAYQGTVNYNAQAGGLSITPTANIQKLEHTITFNYEVVE